MKSRFRSAPSDTQPLARAAVFCVILALPGMSGCEVNSFFDPSKTGRFHFEPTTVPVLERIDVIEERETSWAQAAPPTSDDLLPNDLAYRMAPGDAVTVAVFDLVEPNQWTATARRIDQGGRLRVQSVGDIDAAGLTAQQLEDAIKARLRATRIDNPQVDVVIEQGGGLRYTIYGYIQNAGLFTLQNPDLRILEALSLAGGAPISTERIYVIRRVVLSEDIKPIYERNEPTALPPPRSTTQPTLSIDELIEQMDKDRPVTQPVPEPSSSPMPEAAPESSTTPDEIAPNTPVDPDPPSPGMLSQDGQPPPVDIDELEPVKAKTEPPPIDVDTLNRQGQTTQPGTEDSFIFVPERGEWVRVRKSAPGTTPGRPAFEREATPIPEQQMILERVIEIDFERLSHGDQSQNIVVRPGDNIYIDGPPNGYVYIGGEIFRPGVYSLPNIGRLTLSRLVDTAGGLNSIAIPERVDLVRRISKNREATIRLDLAAIRQRTEPDIMIKGDDHVIIGTSWIATPLAIIRNGFRATYGFGFLLDRNFGNDVFGPPPEDNGVFN